eukprot:15483693-Alexandrium_andersonii.AAC.1
MQRMLEMSVHSGHEDWGSSGVSGDPRQAQELSASSKRPAQAGRPGGPWELPSCSERGRASEA